MNTNESNQRPELYSDTFPYGESSSLLKRTTMNENETFTRLGVFFKKNIKVKCMQKSAAGDCMSAMPKIEKNLGRPALSMSD